MSNLLWSIRSRMVLTIIIVVIIAGGLGYLADRYFGTSPKLLFAAVIISFPLTNFFAVKVGKGYARREVNSEKEKSQ